MTFKFKHIFFFAATLLVIGSCKKKQYPPSVVDDDPVYYSNLQVDNDAVTIKAGEGGYYMYSAIQQDSSNVFNFVSRLANSNCTGCGPGLQIQINDFQTAGLNGPMLVDSAIRVKRYQFFTVGSTSQFDVDFSSSFNRSAPSSAFTWNFGDGVTYTGTTPVHRYTRAGKYQVCLTANSSNGCVSNNCYQIHIGSSTLVSGVNVLATSGDTMMFSHSTSGGNAPYKVRWSFGDGTTSTADAPTHTFPFGGSYPVTLQVTDAKNDTVTIEYNAVTKNDNSSCAANFKVINIAPLAGSSAWSKVVVSWTDASGNTFRSSEAAQPQSAFFDIVSVQEGGVNESGLHTKKVNVKFNCRVFFGGNFHDIKNADAVIAVPYK